jgi:hypothetical protein
MAKDRKKDRADPVSAKGTATRGTRARGSAGGGTRPTGSQASGGEHHAAKAHGRPAQVDTRLPATRPELMALHTEARKRRAAAPLGSEAFRAAVDEIARIEIRIADVDRAQDPPLG